MTTLTQTIPAWFIREGQPIVKEEIYDPNVMDAILRDTDSYSQTTLRQLSLYKKSREGANRHKVIYEFGKGYETAQLGRLYVRNNLGLQAFPSDVRNALLEKFYWDCDMENAHYWIFLEMGRKLGIKVDAIETYCNNRDACLEKVSSDRLIAKIAFLKVGYGGSVSEMNSDWNCEIKEDLPEPEGDLSLLKLIKAEVDVMKQLIWSNNPEAQRIVKAKRKKNPINSVFALVAQNEERKCLLSMERYLENQNRNVDVLIHDGNSIRKLDGEQVFPDELLRGAEKAILDNAGYTMKLVIKPWKHGFKPKETKFVEVIDDAYAARVFIKLCGEFIQRDENKVFYFDETNGLWGSEEDMFLKVVLKFKEKLIFRVMVGIEEKVLNYGGCLKNIKAMSPLILAQLEDTKFLSRNADTSIGKFLFADGIFDFKTGFTKGFDPKIVFIKRIDRPFPSSVNPDLVEKIDKILFVDAFDDGANKDAGLYLKKAFTMGLFGDYRRKKFYIGIGDADCGKGVSIDAFKESFGGYADDFSANELLYNPNNSQDEARRLAWVKDLVGVRIAFASEIRMEGKGADGNLIKAVASGGDRHKGRGNYENGTHFVNRSTMFLLCNDFTKITPSPAEDSGLKERLRFARYELRFVDDPKASNERPKDRALKHKFQTDEYRDALFQVIWNCYRDMSDTEKEIGGDFDTPECVKSETNDWVSNGGGSFKSALLDRYEITNNYEDTVSSKELIKHILQKVKGQSSNKIGRAIRQSVKTTNWSPEEKEKIFENKGGNVTVYHGLREIVIGQEPQ